MGREVVLAAVGAVGFAVIFGMKKDRLWIIFLSSALAWYGYRVLGRILSNDITALFAITVVVVIWSEEITVFWKAPAMLYSTPILIPFIPGATLYYTMSDLIRKNSQFNTHLQLLIAQVGAMALGILVAEMIVLCKKSHCIYGADSIY